MKSDLDAQSKSSRAVDRTVALAPVQGDRTVAVTPICAHVYAGPLPYFHKMGVCGLALASWLFDFNSMAPCWLAIRAVPTLAWLECGEGLRQGYIPTDSP
ncbi:hypothetical protein VNO77_03164 [Canavalia gladiata]|uniref:Uncharacterized protein n=1 Tax=Canavalia gladiata TaxID=3824 RepID=A0AAN9MUW3_CANGL